MGDKTLPDIAETMKDIDFVMLQTKTDGGQIAARPMSNNRDVEYDGDSWFFLFEESRTFQDVERDPKVGISLQTNKGLLGKPPTFIAIEGQAQIIRDKAAFAEHWTDDMERYAKDGIDTPGLAMIKVHKSLREGGFRTKMLLTVHDEIVFDLHKSEQDSAVPLIVDCMTSALPLKVPLRVDTGVGPNWFEAK